jgi:integrase
MRESDSESIPSDIEATAENVVASLLPEKSKDAYEQTYVKLEIWCKAKGIKNIHNEKVLLAYFDYLSKLRKASSLWVYYSMLRSMISLKQNIDISKYVHLIAFLKRKSEGFRSKKSKVLRKEDITKFLKNADDKTYFMMKVALIVGLAGACRRDELTNLRMENVRDEGQCIHIVIPNTKTKISREFFVTSGNIEGTNMVEIVRRYIAIRPCNVDHSRFFIAYRNGKCIKQPVGVNMFGKIPRIIASFLNLPNPEQYTGHCFRRSSASLLADSGADLLTVKRHGGWRSNTVAEGYIEDSVENKKKIASKILGDISNIGPSTSSKNHEINFVPKNSNQMSSSGLNVTNCKKFVINVVYNK